jgi:nitrate/nitrite transport system substrate-binding protein
VIQDVPDRIDFDPFPWHSMGVWILTQMKRWGYIEGDIDYKASPSRSTSPPTRRKIMKELGYDAPAETYKNYMSSWARSSTREPEDYVESFAIKRG